MKKMTITIISLVIVLSVILTGMSRMVLKDVKPTEVGTLKYQVVSEHTFDDDTKQLIDDNYISFDKIDSLDSLIEKSDYVLLVEAMEIKKLYFSEVLREVQILDTIKADHELSDPIIGVLEPLAVDGNDHSVLVANGYIPMQEGFQYYLFLENVIGRQQHGTLKLVSREYGKFFADHEPARIISILHHSEEMPKVSSVTEYDFANIFQEGEQLEISWTELNEEKTENKIDISRIQNVYVQIKSELNQHVTSN